jgi:SAM-dependent methyltransferase
MKHPWSVEDVEDPVVGVRAYFDALGAGEWDRLMQSPRARVSFELHRRLLARFVRPGNRVLEIGAGPGRFTIVLADLGATVVVSDVSEVQLSLNEAKVNEAGRDAAVERRLLIDVRDLDAVDGESFDAVVAFGGPLSYAFELAEHALGECLRVTKPGGVVLASVMTTIGAMRLFLPAVVDEMDRSGLDVTDAVIRTGDLGHNPDSAHRCRMFRWRELNQMIARQPCQLLAASASNATSAGDVDALERIAANADWWMRFLDWEEELAQEPGTLDGGTHTLFALRRT